MTLFKVRGECTGADVVRTVDSPGRRVQKGDSYEEWKVTLLLTLTVKV